MNEIITAESEYFFSLSCYFYGFVIDWRWDIDPACQFTEIDDGLVASRDRGESLLFHPVRSATLLLVPSTMTYHLEGKLVVGFYLF